MGCSTPLVERFTAVEQGESLRVPGQVHAQVDAEEDDFEDFDEDDGEDALGLEDDGGEPEQE